MRLLVGRASVPDAGPLGLARVYPPALFRYGSAAGAPVLPTTVQNLFVRKTGSDNNGGSSSGTSPDRTGGDGVANGTTTFTAATGSFTSADVNKLINIVTKGRYRITAVGSGTSITLSGAPSAGSSLTWNLGGATVTIGALLANANGAILGGDRVWIGAGVYREVVAFALTPTFELRIVGDFDGAMTGDSGEVRWTAFLTDDKTAPSASAVFNMNNKSNITLERIVFQAGTASPGCITGGGGVNITLRDCWFGQLVNGSNQLVSFGGPSGQPSNLLIERCTFVGGTGGGSTLAAVQLGPSLAGADYDTQITIRNCVFAANNTAVRCNVSGSGAGKPYGIRIANCFMWGQSTCLQTGDANSGWIVTGSVLIAATAMNASAATQIVSSYNVIWGTMTNVPLGVGDKQTTYAPFFHLGQEAVYGGVPRQPFTPVAGSGLLGFNTSGLANDLVNSIRPAGGSSPLTAVGALERGNTFIADTSPIGAGGSPIKVTGPGYAEFLLPIAASQVSKTITVSCKVKRDSTYTGPPPQLQLDRQASMSVLPQTVSGQAAAATVETVTLKGFVPAAAGLLKIRVVSSDSNGAGVLQVDDFTVVGT